MNKTLRSDQVVIVAVACLLAGYVLGLVTSFFIWNKPGPTPGTVESPAPNVAGPGSAMGNLSAEIREITRIVEGDPKNRGAWVRLGNLHFDSNQYAEAIQAYTKALELKPDDPDVITDRAIMYRAIGDFKQAAAELRRAADMDPKHLNSLMNLGVVLRYDLNDREGAMRAWQSYLDRSPPPDMAERIRKELETLRSQGK
ncbi:MAG: tetratricopeptide repeat protein [Deltaproteobacteria bacterium]|nr:tetratricopeptide repeat protein [Deltaproteobacteria bacterium]